MRWFPFSSLHVPPVALYLSDHTLAVLRLNAKREVLSFGRAPLPDGIMLDGKVLDRAKLVEAVRLLCKSALPRPIVLTQELPVIFSIPESQSFTHVFTVPAALPKEELSDTVRSNALGLIPVELTSLYWDWQLITEGKGQTDHVLFAAAPKEIIDAYIAVCEECNLLPLAIDMETISLARALLPPDDRRPSIIMDIGARATVLGFFDETHRLGLSVSIPIGGNSFTNALIDRLHVSWEDAEELKQRQGLDRMIPENRTLIILQERAQAILRDLGKASDYFESTYHKPVSRVILCGGSSLIPGLDTYLAINLKLEVTLGDAFRLLSRSDATLAHIPQSIFFAPAVGLALRALEKNPDKNGINLLHGWEGERWEERERKILERWKKLALPLFVASVILLSYVLYAYVYWPLSRLNEASRSRVALSGIAPLATTSTATTSDIVSHAPTTGTSSAIIDTLLGATSSPQTLLPATTSAQESILPVVRIIDTPTGWLNVRSGPGSTYPLLTKVSPGETYPLLEKENDWVKIDLGIKGSGWVSSTYTKEETGE